MEVIISQEYLQAARMSDSDLLKEVAVMLYQKNRLSLAQASRLAKMSRFQFQHLLASRRVPVNYDVSDFEEDLTTLKQLS